MLDRISWTDYFINMAHLASTRSTCNRRNIGCVIVKGKHVLATGYNGAVANAKHCSQVGCLREEMEVPSGERHELCRALHAEQNAFLQAARHGVNLDGSTLYVTIQPCGICAKMLINAGVKKIVIEGEYPDKFALDLLMEAGVEMEVLGK